MQSKSDESAGVRSSIRRAPLAGDVVDAEGCGPGPEGYARIKRGGCCGKDLGPMDDLEDPSPEDIERFSDVTRKCPSCGKEVFDDAEVCYHCGEAMSQPTKGLPVWAIVGAVLAILALVVFFVF